MKQIMIGIAFLFSGTFMLTVAIASKCGNGLLELSGICLGAIGLVILFYELYCAYHSRAAFQNIDSFGEESDDSEK